MIFLAYHHALLQYTACSPISQPSNPEARSGIASGTMQPGGRLAGDGVVRHEGGDVVRARLGHLLHCNIVAFVAVFGRSRRRWLGVGMDGPAFKAALVDLF